MQVIITIPIIIGVLDFMFDKNHINRDTISTETRSYLYDNARALLITLVVFGHFISAGKKDSIVAETLYNFIFFFHMPAFIFISGYFSKNLDKIRNNAVEKILIPYILLNVMSFFYEKLILADNIRFGIFTPRFGLWFLLALFIWRFFLKDIIRIRFILPLSFVIGLLSGYSHEFRDLMALGRVVGFLPFFLLGFYCTKENVDKIRKIPKILSCVVMIAVAIISLFISKIEFVKSGMFHFNEAYKLSSSNYYELLFRMLFYIIALVMIIVILNLVPERKTFFSQIGTATMPVYVLHLYIWEYIKQYQILHNHTYLYIIFSVISSIVIVYLLSRPIIKRIYDNLMNKAVGLILNNKSSSTER
jgi:fucose 4-O-acetylase-like acetyltransferase